MSRLVTHWARLVTERSASRRGSLVTLPADWVTVRIATGDGHG